MRKAKGALGSLREIIFGLEDGIVSTMGVITGIASGTQNKFTVILAGLVVISVESLSMAAGTYLSSKTEAQFEASQEKGGKTPSRTILKEVKKDALFMGIAYIFGGIIPTLPYLFMPFEKSIIASIVFSVVALILVGVWRAKVTKTSILKGVVEMVTISLSAAAIGYLIGEGARGIFPQLQNVNI